MILPSELRASLRVVVGSTTSRTLTLFNSGNAVAHIQSIDLDFADSSLTASHTCGAAIPIGAPCDVQITFSPTTAGLHAAQLMVRDAVAGDLQWSISVEGLADRAPIAVALTPSVSSSVVGQPVTFAVMATSTLGTPSGGNVTLFDGQTPLLPTGTLSSGQATIQISSLSVGIHSITASYDGDALHLEGTSSPLTQTVIKQSTTTSLGSSATSLTYGQPLTLMATVTPQFIPATGSVTFTDAGHQFSQIANLTGNTAPLPPVTLGPGVWSFSASYSGDQNSNPSASPSPIAVTVAKATTTTTLLASPNPAFVGQNLTFVATVTPQFAGTPGGTVSFKNNNGAPVNVPVVNGEATLTAAYTSTVRMTATYSGDANFVLSISPQSVVPVNKAATTVTVLTSSRPASFVGEAVTFTAVFGSDSPAGPPPDGSPVTFTFAGVQQPPVLMQGGVASITTSALAAGTPNIRVHYAASAMFTGAAVNLTQRVSRYDTAIRLTAAPAPSTFGQAVTFTAVVTAQGAQPPDGSPITFSGGGIPSATVGLSNGVAMFTTSALAAGTRQIRANYGGNAAFLASTSNVVNQLVAPAATTTALNSSANPASRNSPVTSHRDGHVGGRHADRLGHAQTRNHQSGHEAIDQWLDDVRGDVPQFRDLHDMSATVNGSGNFGGSSTTLSQRIN